jgi:hypothetical protein
MEESETDPYGIGPVGCRCDTSRPQPELCERPEQYQCSVGLSSWFECYCDEQAPLSQEDCEGSSQFFYCQSQDPIYGCICITGIR